MGLLTEFNLYGCFSNGSTTLDLRVLPRMANRVATSGDATVMSKVAEDPQSQLVTRMSLVVS